MEVDFRKALIATLSLVLAMGNSVTVFAEDTDMTGGRGDVKKDIYQVVLPTETDGIFDFIIDPQQLITKTGAAMHGGKTFEHGATLFFKRSDGKAAEEYSSCSDFITITNQSTVPVDVYVDVSVLPSSISGMSLSSDPAFTDDTSASIYLALTDGQNTVPVSVGNASIHATIDAAPEDAYEYSLDTMTGEENYQLKSDLSGVQFPEYSFQLIGASNENGDWSSLTAVIPKVNVAWRVVPRRNIESNENTIFNKKIILDETTEIHNDSESEEDIEHSSLPVQDGTSSENVWDSKEEKVKDGDSGSDEDSIALDEKDTSEQVVSEENNISDTNAVPHIQKTSYKVTSDEPISIEIDLGSGDMAATKVSSVRWKDSKQELLDDKTDCIQFKDSKVVLAPDWLKDNLPEDEQQAILVITFDDVASTEVEVALET